MQEPRGRDGAAGVTRCSSNATFAFHAYTFTFRFLQSHRYSHPTSTQFQILPVPHTYTFYNFTDPHIPHLHPYGYPPSHTYTFYNFTDPHTPHYAVLHVTHPPTPSQFYNPSFSPTPTHPQILTPSQPHVRIQLHFHIP